MLVEPSWQDAFWIESHQSNGYSTLLPLLRLLWIDRDLLHSLPSAMTQICRKLISSVIHIVRIEFQAVHHTVFFSSSFNRVGLGRDPKKKCNREKRKTFIFTAENAIVDGREWDVNVIEAIWWHFVCFHRRSLCVCINKWCLECVNAIQ